MENETVNVVASAVAAYGPSVSIARACALVGVSKRTMYNWMHTGKVAWIYIASSSRRVVTESLYRSEADVALTAKYQRMGQLGQESLKRHGTQYRKL